MRDVTTILCLLSAIHWFDNVIEITHSAQNPIWTEVPMKELSNSTSFSDGMVHLDKFTYVEFHVPSMTIKASSLSCSDDN